MKRIFVLLILAFLVLGAAASVYADGSDESQTPVLPQGTAPELVKPEEATPEAADPQPRGAVRGYVRGHARIGPRVGHRQPVGSRVSGSFRPIGLMSS